MNILTICSWGKNRSSYLAAYLQQKGYIVKFGGIHLGSDTPVTQDTVDWSNVLIFVHPQIEKEFLERFQVKNQRMTTLNVDDHIEATGDEWLRIQEQYVYPQLEQEIDKYLPLR